MLAYRAYALVMYIWLYCVCVCVCVCVCSYGLTDTLVRDINEATPGISFQIETGKCYILNKRDKCGRPIVVVHVRRHDQNKQSRDELTRYGIHVLERCTELLQVCSE